MGTPRTTMPEAIPSKLETEQVEVDVVVVVVVCAMT